MKTLLTKLQDIEHYLLRRGDDGDKLVFEARMIIDPDLEQQTNLQRQAYTIVQQYGRRKLKAELEVAHHELFSKSKHRRFSQKIMALFK